MNILILPAFAFLLVYFFEKICVSCKVIYIITPHLIAKLLSLIQEKIREWRKPAYPIQTVVNGYPIIEYKYEGKIYKHCISNNNRTTDVLLITDDDGTDITYKVLPYMGPNRNVTAVIPQLWNTKSLTFEMVDGTTFVVC